jgi:hypothetical protein
MRNRPLAATSIQRAISLVLIFVAIGVGLSACGTQTRSAAAVCHVFEGLQPVSWVMGLLPRAVEEQCQLCPA